MKNSGPLKGVKVIEMAGIGPGPFCGMMLSDMGADVLRIERHGKPDLDWNFFDQRGRTRIALDLKKQGDIAYCLQLAEGADILFEGFRPGVMERVGLGPDIVLKRNPRIIYGRMTGWGQTGPYAQMAGHDINYIAITGALHGIGPADRPAPPLNIVGDFGGGGMMLLAGLLAALVHARETGKGQVVDAAISDGTNMLMNFFHGLASSDAYRDQRAGELLNGGAHFYNTYQCKDGKWISVGSIEPQFYALLLEKTDLEDLADRPQNDPETWEELAPRLAAAFKTKSRDEWCAIMEGTDVCFAPVLDLAEARQNPHNKAREGFVEIDGQVHAAPAPRFSETPSAVQWGVTAPREDREVAVAEWLAGR